MLSYKYKCIDRIYIQLIVLLHDTNGLIFVILMFFVFRFKALTSIVKVKILELRELLVSLVLREIPPVLHRAVRGEFQI